MNMQFTLNFDVKYKGEWVYDALITANIIHYYVQKPDYNADNRDDYQGYTDFDYDIICVELVDVDGSSVTITGGGLDNIVVDDILFTFVLESHVIEYIEEFNHAS